MCVQLDSFNRAVQRTNGGGKLTNLFKLKMLAKPAAAQMALGSDAYISAGPAGVVTPSGGSCQGSGAGTPGGSGASPRTPPAVAAAAAAAAAAQHTMSAEDLLTWSNVSECSMCTLHSVLGKQPCAHRHQPGA
jgi:hypothetical protein